jgi:PIN domain nuclease of toxin-antitoxin system
VKLLLDTHAFLWFVHGDLRLSGKARRRIEDARNDSFLSIASVWEMSIKIGLGKLKLPDPLEETLDRGARDNRIGLLAITKAHVLAVSALSKHHGDPFDRLLVVQAKQEQMALVARDPAFDDYSIRRIW